MNDDFNKYMQMIAGANLQKSTEKQLAESDRQRISQAYFDLFYNLTATTWLRGGSLGHAWYTAMAQMKSFVSARDAQNPAAMYMRQLVAAHNARWGQLMMTSPHRDDVIDVSPQLRQEWSQRVAKKSTAALAILNQILAAYKQAAPAPDHKNAMPQAQALRLAQLYQRRNSGATM